MALGSGGSGGNAGGIRAGAAFVELYVKNGLLGGLNQAAKDLKHFGSVVTGMGQSFVKVGAIGGAALGGIFGAAASNAATFDRVAAKLGDTTENLSAFAYAAESVGMNFDDLIDNFENWPERLVAAAEGTGEGAAAFKKLGIDAAKMAQLPITEQMIALAGSMEQVGNESQRLMILGNLFSDKGQWFNELFKKKPEGIRELMKDAEKLGSVVTTEQGKQGREVTGAMAKSWTAIKNAVLQIGAALLPQASTIAAIGESVTGIAIRVRDWIEANREVVIGTGLVLAGITAAGLGMIVLGQAIAAAGVAMTVLAGVASTAGFAIGAIGGLLLSPLVAAGAVVAGVVSEFVDLESAGRDAANGVANAVTSAFGPTWANVSDGWREIVSLIGSGDLEGAFAAATETVEVEWSRLMLFLDNQWREWTGFFEDSFIEATAYMEDIWEDFINLRFIKIIVGAAEGFWAFVEDIDDAFHWVVDSISELWDGVVNALGDTWDEFTNTRFMRGLKKALEGLQYWLEDLWSLLTDWEIVDPKAHGLLQPTAELIPFEPIPSVPEMFPEETATLIAGPQETPAERAMREANERRAAGREARAARRAEAMGDAWNFGDMMGEDFGQNGLLGKQIAGNAMKSLGAFGGSANVGMFGQGGDIGKKIADNTKETADGVKKLTGIMSSRHDEKMGQLTVEGGT